MISIRDPLFLLILTFFLIINFMQKSFILFIIQFIKFIVQIVWCIKFMYLSSQDHFMMLHWWIAHRSTKGRKFPNYTKRNLNCRSHFTRNLLNRTSASICHCESHDPNQPLGQRKYSRWSSAIRLVLFEITKNGNRYFSFNRSYSTIGTMKWI